MKFKVNYFIIFFISFFLLTLLYLFFKVSFNNDLSHAYYIKYYLILATVSLFLITSFFFNKNIFGVYNSTWYNKRFLQKLIWLNLLL